MVLAGGAAPAAEASSRLRDAHRVSLSATRFRNPRAHQVPRMGSCKIGGARMKKGSATGSGSKLTRFRSLKSDDFANEFGGAARI
jgi:hypothetical protein